MRIAVAGAGPAGLYFTLLARRAMPEHEITVFERNPAGATYGWGVVFSDRTLTSFREADYKTYDQIIEQFIIWDAIDVFYRDGVVRCRGQVFSGIARRTLLDLLSRRCEELGASLLYEHEIEDPAELGSFDLIVAADGIRSVIRDAQAERFRPSVRLGSSRYIWFGTRRVFDSFTFAFRSNDAGFWQAHAYPFDGETSTFIVECDAETWERSGLDELDEAGGVAYCEALFRDELGGHRLMSNNSKWVQFPTLTTARWHSGKTVLVGDAAHTAHFSIGSGTKLAMEDSIALVNALHTKEGLGDALAEYQLERKPRVERFQEAARQSQAYFENTRRFAHMEPLQFAFHLMSRSGRVDYDDLRVRDRRFVGAVDRWFVARDRTGDAGVIAAPPPAFAPLRLGGLQLRNRLVVQVPPAGGGPRRDYFGDVEGWGAGLILTEPIATSPGGRIGPGRPGLYTDEQQSAWADALGALREQDEVAAVAATLCHAGPRGATRPRAGGADIPLPPSDGWPLVAASSVPYARGSAVPDPLHASAIPVIVEEFVETAARAARAGFDMVEVHAGHGYLLASFLSPLTNKRDDEFGGSLEGRLRLPAMVVEAVRAEWPEERPLGVVVTAADWARGGVSMGETLEVAARFASLGCDVVRVVAGQTLGRFRPRYDPYWLVHYADTIRNETGVPVIATGDIETVDDVNTIVAGGRADLCLLRRVLA